jgi:hypothetical protein
MLVLAKEERKMVLQRVCPVLLFDSDNRQPLDLDVIDEVPFQPICVLQTVDCCQRITGMFARKPEGQVCIKINYRNTNGSRCLSHCSTDVLLTEEATQHTYFCDNCDDQHFYVKTHSMNRCFEFRLHKPFDCPHFLQLLVTSDTTLSLVNLKVRAQQCCIQTTPLPPHLKDGSVSIIFSPTAGKVDLKARQGKQLWDKATEECLKFFPGKTEEAKKALKNRMDVTMMTHCMQLIESADVQRDLYSNNLQGLGWIEAVCSLTALMFYTMNK